jgi:D-glycero-D-manno-heptose 1,7-bisphosphate phosphatase
MHLVGSVYGKLLQSCSTTGLPRPGIYCRDAGALVPGRASQMNAESDVIAIRLKDRKASARQAAGFEPYVFLDKDGTLIENAPYNVDTGRVRLVPGARDAIAMLAAHGWPVAVVTNQSGIARGLFTAEELVAVGLDLLAELTGMGARVGGFYACPHHPAGLNRFAIECTCRKPEPGLILLAGAELGADLRSSWVVGDSWTDAVAGRRAGCRTILIDPSGSTQGPPRAERPDFSVPSLVGAVSIIVADRRTESSVARSDPPAPAFE